MTFLASYPVLAVIFFIAILVFVHETGHFLVGKACGIGVEIYSLGFGPRLFGITHRGTDYRISLLPLGGYVKFAGALPSEEVPKGFQGKEMHRASIGARAATILAGPLANLLLAVGLFALLGYQGLEQPAPVLGSVLPSGPAAKAGLLPGDRITQIGDKPIQNWNQVREAIGLAAGKTLEVEVKRLDETLNLSLTPEVVADTESGLGGSQGRVGISYGLVPAVVSPGLLDSGVQGQSAQGQYPALSPAMNAGLEVGDKILALSFLKDEQAQAPEKSFLSVSSWPDFLQKLEIAWAQKTLFLELKITDLKLATRQVRLPLQAWTAHSQSLQALRPLERQVELASLLGLYDSQLTVATASEGLEGKLLPGDRLLRFKGEPLRDVFALSELLQANRESSVALQLQRGQKIVEQQVTLKPVEVQKPAGKETYYSLPLSFLGQVEFPEPVLEVYKNPLDALAFGLRETADKTAAVVGAIFGLITGKVPLKALGGPMLIAKVAGDAAEAGWQAFFATMAMISINLGVFNLFPMPALDGGQLVLLLAEGVRRKPLSELALENFQRLGFVMVLSLVVLATYNDLSRFWAGLLRGLSGFLK